jgi:DNA-binding NarL/FixJ family response regulator
MPEEEHAFLRAVRAGAQGYVLDEASASDLLAAVRSICHGQSVCPASLVGTLFRQVARPKSEMPNIQIRLRLGLTRREQQLIPLIAQGLTNKEIASHFGLSEQTVKNHIHRMLHKVGARDRLAVVDFCRDEGFHVA